MKDLLTTLAEMDIEYNLVQSKTDEEDFIVELPSRNIKIHVSTTYWRHPGIYSYFVNYSKDKNNFSCHAGTMRISEVIYWIGYHAPKINDE